MKVIFLQNVKKVGQKDQVKEINSGYAMNFLIPQKLAMEATPSALAQLEKKLKEKASGIEKGTAEFRETVQRLEGFVLIVKKKANAEGHLFSSVTLKDIVTALLEKDFHLSEKDLDLRSPLKVVGKISVPIKNTDKNLNVSIEAE
jgi:large subunit ribosomal protein L9